MGLPFAASELLASWCPSEIGESFCPNPTDTLEDVRPGPFSVDSSLNSPSPGFLVISLFLLNSALEGEEWTDAEVMASSESSGNVSVSFRGPRLTAEDWITLGTPLGNVVATCTLFVRLTEGLRRAVELFSSSILPEAKVLLWEVRAVAIAGPTGETVTFVLLEELFLPLACAVSVWGVKFSGASEGACLLLGV